MQKALGDALHLDGVGGVYSNLVIGGIAVLNAQVKVFYIQVQVWQDELDPEHALFFKLRPMQCANSRLPLLFKVCCLPYS